LPEQPAVCRFFTGLTFVLRPGWPAALLMIAAATLAHPPTEPIKPGHPTGHVEKPKGMTWPPQPPGISDVHDQSDFSGQARRKLDRDLKFSNLERQFGDVEPLKPLAGRRMTRLSIEEVSEKAAPTRVERRFHYFDRQANATITVVQRPEGKYERRVTPAWQYQPEITDDEGAEAVALAKAYFATRGFTRAQGLKGFAIQAYPPSGTVFYDGRVVYVSLHVDSDSPPEYVAWVDLTRQSIMAARQEPQR
jgi:hypothetical protein